MGTTIGKTNCCQVDQISSNLTLSAEAERLSMSLDDEPILLSSSLDESRGESPLISPNLKFGCNYLQQTNETQEWPVCLNISCADQSIDERGGIDLVCLIETSSMTYDKSEVIHKCIEFVMGRLSGQDRLSIVTFSDAARRLCPLISMSYTGKVKIGLLIRNLIYNGSCDLAEALVFALSVLNNRRNFNSSAHILLFSTGKDNHPDSVKERISDILREFTYRINGSFTINIFALSSPLNILTYISEETNGSCYFNKDDKSLMMSLAYCCGIMESKVAEDVSVKIVIPDIPIPVVISKVYSENAENVFRLPDVLAGMSMDTTFLMRFFPCPDADFRVLEIVRVLIQYKIKGIVRVEEVGLSIPIFPMKKVCKEIEIDENVLVSFYRVKAADIMFEAAEMALVDLAGAVQLLVLGSKELDECCVRRNHLVQTLSSELKVLKDKIARSEEIRAYIRNRARNHWTKRCNDVPDYHNSATTINKNRLRALFNYIFSGLLDSGSKMYPFCFRLFWMLMILYMVGFLMVI